jgi:4-amino-4-deoxy-L-arabinose transferase-like glycosyltransferase
MFSKTWVIKNRLWVIFIGIIVLAIFLRFWQLGAIPDGFHVDEAFLGYNAYSLMKTGRDEYGALRPLISRGFIDYGGSICSYIIIPFIYAFGLSEWSVRVPTALFGILFILLTYAIVYRLSKNRVLALVSMALAAISPIGILLSRAQSFFVSFVIFYGAVYCWLLWVEKRTLRYLCLALFGIIVSFYTYTGIQLLALPFLLLSIAWYWHTLDKRSKITVSAFFLIILLFVAGLFFSQAGTRFSQISVFSTMNVQLPLDEELREDGAQHQPMLVTRMLHNKVTAYGRFIIKNFTDYVSFQFLFFDASQPQRERIPNMGVLLLIECPFLLIGIYTAIKKKYSYGILSILWFLLVPAALSIGSEETPNIHRFFLAMLPIHVLVAIGILTSIQAVKTRYRTAFVICILFLYVLNVFYFMHELFIHQPIHAPIYRNAPDKALAIALKDVYSSYDVVVSQKILPHILFFWPVDPATYQKEGSPRDTDNSWYRNILFVADACPSHLSDPAVVALKAKRILYVDRAGCAPLKNDVIIKTIKYKNTLDAYYLIVKRTIANN